MNLKGYRASKGLTIEDVSKELGVSRETYRKKEAGKHRIFLDEAFKLADLFGVTIEQLHEATRS